jgi:protein gp37
MKRNSDWWWDRSWNTVDGCDPHSPGCTNCYAAQIAGTKTWPVQHQNVTIKRGKRYIFNGVLHALPFEHHLWSWPLRWAGSEDPCLGVGMPSLIFVGDMSDLFHELRPVEAIDRTAATIAASEHIGLLLTKRADQMAAYFLGQDLGTIQRWQPKLWLGFSGEDQEWFDRRWKDMKSLAEAGWLVFVSIAPMLDPVTLPPDFLAYGPRAWVIVAGEQGAHDRCRDMEPSWARAIRDQCREAGVPFFMKQLERNEPIPPDLHIRQFPSLLTMSSTQRPDPE